MEESGMHIRRFPTNPIIRPHMDDCMGDNINGPSLIRVPDWMQEPLGRYYLYFAHHDGRYIRLAYSHELQGPWPIHREGVLPLREALFAGHVASPDVHVDHAPRQIRPAAAVERRRHVSRSPLMDSTLLPALRTWVRPTSVSSTGTGMTTRWPCPASSTARATV